MSPRRVPPAPSVPPGNRPDIPATEARPATTQLRLVSVIAQNPDVKSELDRGVLRTHVAVLDDALRPGPRGPRFHVVDLDTTTGRATRPVRLNWTAHERRAETNAGMATTAFRAGNLYAVAASVLLMFEQQLGRRMTWSFPSPQLFLVPSAFIGDNAYYSPEQHGVMFGYVTDDTGTPEKWTSLSHDVIAHEVTHAILDGLRPRWLEPALPDQAALHEGVADLVALLGILGSADVIEQSLARDQSPDDLRAVSKGPLLEVAGAASTIRSSLADLWVLSSSQIAAMHRDEIAPHRRCELIVAAACEAMLMIWSARCERLRERRTGMSRRAIANEGAKSAQHVLGMCLRALDYLPPAEVEFIDLLDTILAADEDVAPDDPLEYRPKLRTAFERFGIRARYGTHSRGRVSAVERITRLADYSNLNRTSLAHDPDEVYRFIWQNPWILHSAVGDHPAALDYQLDVERVRGTTRIGPDGLVLDEVFADYTQIITTTAHDLAGHPGFQSSASTTPDWLASLAPDTQIRLRGGGTLIFGQFGQLRLVCRKPIDDWDRQARRLRHLVTNDLTSTAPSFGVSYGSTDDALRALHGTDLIEESW